MSSLDPVIEQLIVQLDSGQYANAEFKLRQLIKAKPKNFLLHLLHGNALRYLGELDKAVASYKKSLNIEPLNAPTYWQLGATQLKQHKYGPAVFNLRKALQLKPDLYHVCIDLGAALSEQKKYVEAAEAYEMGLAGLPDELSLHYGFVCALQAMGDVDASERWSAELGLPLMQRLADEQKYDKMIVLMIIFDHYLKVQDREDRYSRACVKAADLYYHSIRRADSSFSALPVLAASPGETKRRVAFFVEALSDLAHCRNLYNYVSAIVSRDDLNIQPLIFCVQATAKSVSLYRDLGIEVERLPVASAIEERGIAFRHKLKAVGVNTCVFLGTIQPYWMFLIGLRVAPIQIWWSQKYHGLNFDNIDGYLTLGGVEPHRDIGGRSWRCIPGLFGPEITVPAEPGVELEADTIRKSLRGANFKRVAGVIGREEKIDNDEYWDCIAQILNRHEDVLFIWSGRSERSSIQKRIESRGLAGRCKFVGWVNTKLYVNVVDIYLDSFPFPGGHTLVEAIIANKPVVSLITDDGKRIGIPIFAEPWLRQDGGAKLREKGLDPIFTGPEGEDLLPFVEEVTGFVERALLLLDDDQYRSMSIEANKQFVLRYLTDVDRAADMLCMHIDEVNRDRTDAL